MTYRHWFSGKNSSLQCIDKRKTNLELQEIKTKEEIVKMSGSYNTNVFLYKNDLFRSTGKFLINKNPVKDKNDPIVLVNSGYSHHFILTESGRLFAFGSNGSKQICPQNSTMFNTPTEINFFRDNKLKVICITGGEFHSTFLCDNGDYYGIGDNTYYQLETNLLTIDKNKITLTEKKRTDFTLLSQNVKLVGEGVSTRHTTYLTEDNTLWIQGYNNTGQCGNSTKINKILPQKIEYLDNENIQKICNGFEVSLIWIGDNEIYTCGNNEYNGHSIEKKKFTKLDFFDDIFVKNVLVGSRHFLLLSQDNKVYGFGKSGCKFPFSGKPTEFKLPNYEFGLPLEIATSCYNFIVFPASGTSILSDFKNLYKNQEFTDFGINGVKIHKSFIEFRLNNKMENIQEKLNNYPKEDLDIFFYWLYSDEMKNHKLIQSICTKFGIENAREKKLKDDLVKLYNDEDSKDFKVLVQDEDDYEEEDDDDEDEDNFEEIPLHKFVLLARSGLFREMFKTITQKEKQINQIKDFSRKSIESLEILFKFFYTNKIELTADDDPQLTIEELNDSEEYYQLTKGSNLNHELLKIKKQFKLI
ncbi:hypothetical protein M0812_14063 [Anaeramoeba flamelloides]|uniref:BTB domain-containing protein n=1 Tax=Anaeramoeba flamelloides TaxID=1746091 RepID=A0AAV7ZHL5_9EUKA|nr:hypothetical protein M0812_14063 [Anaeramoeba flamelloides]